MIASPSVRVRVWPWAALGLFLASIATAAAAADCPGHPDALGTSRTLVVDPRQHPRIGTMQYAETLPLGDHEVVLTFDDGPLPKYSNQVLQILADECVKATFFLIGGQAKANPEGVRKVRAAGHTVATHTQNHPIGMRRLPIEQARQELDDGIASVTAALGDGSTPAPFFRIPGLSRAEDIEEYAASKGIQVWSADFPADDWRHVSPSRVYDLAIQRLETMGKGILLLHDIHPRTVVALPRILHELKVRGYRIVHVVPATPEQPATPTEPVDWLLHPTSETVAVTHWPKIPNFVFARSDTLPAPGPVHLEWRDTTLFDQAQERRGAPSSSRTSWPNPAQPAQSGGASTLPVPAASVFKIPEGARVTLLAAGSQRAGAVPQNAQLRHAAHRSLHSGRGAPKRTVRLANAKKR